MSSIVKPPNSRNYHVDVPMPDGDPKRISARTPNKEAAKVIGATLQLFAKKHHGKRVSLLTIRQTADMLAKTVNTECLERHPIEITLPKLAEETAISGGNLKLKRLVVSRFITYMAEQRLQAIDMWDVCPAHISGFYKSIRDKYNIGDVSHRVYGHTLGGLFEKARLYKIVPENVARLVPLPKRPKGSPRRPFTKEELRATYQVADEEWRGMITVGACTGMRIGDVSTLVCGDIDFDTGFIRPLVKKVRQFEPKPIPDAYLKRFRERCADKAADAPLFPRAYGWVMSCKSGSTSRVSGEFVKLLIRAGVRKAGEKVRGVVRIGARKFLPLSFHCLRHTYTTLLKLVCASEAIARELTGHRSQLVSHIYTHIDAATLKNAVKDMPDLFVGLGS